MEHKSRGGVIATGEETITNTRFWGAMQHERLDDAGAVRSDARRCWKNATAMYCRSFTKRDAETRALYVQMAICWAALAAELEKRLALAYIEVPSRDYEGGRDRRWIRQAPTFAADPRTDS